MTEPTNQPPESAPEAPPPAAPPSPTNRLWATPRSPPRSSSPWPLAVSAALRRRFEQRSNPDNLDAGQLRALLGDPTPEADTGVLDPQRPEVGKKAPDFALVDARDPSKVVKLSDYKGKLVIVNWYASWCGPCQREIPALEKLYNAQDGNLVVLGVDFLEDTAQAKSILDDLGSTYPAVADTSGAVSDHYRIGSGGKASPGASSSTRTASSAASPSANSPPRASRTASRRWT